MVASVAIVYYSMYGHVRALVRAAEEGVKATGAKVSVYQVAETLPEEVLQKMGAPGPQDDPVIDHDVDLEQFDGFIFAVPTRFGTPAGQFKAWIDSLGGYWMKGALNGKFASIIVSTAQQGGGQETTPVTLLPSLAHLGIVYVPIGYTHKGQFSLDELRGGSPWGAGTLAAGDGSRMPSELELDHAKHAGSYFSNILNTFVAGKPPVQDDAAEEAAKDSNDKTTQKPVSSGCCTIL